MVARHELFPAPLSWQTQIPPPAADPGKPHAAEVSSWQETLRSPQTKVVLALGLGMVLGWLLKRR
jgi:hypothetical protein